MTIYVSLLKEFLVLTILTLDKLLATDFAAFVIFHKKKRGGKQALFSF
jgi:hypothetical protein